MIHKVEATIGGRTLTIETGRVAEQAGGAVLLRYGDTVVLGTATASESPREGIDFFPLTVDVEERMYAAGKIPGGFIKREGRPTEHSILAVAADRPPDPPALPQGLSQRRAGRHHRALRRPGERLRRAGHHRGLGRALDLGHSVRRAGRRRCASATSTARSSSIRPRRSCKSSQLDLVVAGTADAVVMVEAGAKELPEETMIAAIARGARGDADADHQAAEAVAVAAAGKPKRDFAAPEPDAALGEAVAEFVRPRFDARREQRRQGRP